MPSVELADKVDESKKNTSHLQIMGQSVAFPAPSAGEPPKTSPPLLLLLFLLSLLRRLNLHRPETESLLLLRRAHQGKCAQPTEGKEAVAAAAAAAAAVAAPSKFNACFQGHPPLLLWHRKEERGGGVYSRRFFTHYR